MLILASASPRRKELLEQAGYSFKVIVSKCEEIMNDNLRPEVLVAENAVLKAKAVAAIYPGEYVLGADTVVSVDGYILGKPKNEEDAIRMLTMLQDRSHTVSTGIALVCFVDNEFKVLKEAVTTEVYFGPMTAEEIQSYVATGEPLDKAGAYGIQGKAAAFIQGIRGSYSNVVGLPLYNVRKLAGLVGVDMYGKGEGFTS